MIRLSQVKLPVDHTEEQLYKKVAHMLRCKPSELKKVTIVRQSIDARKKPELFFSYVIDVLPMKEEKLWKECARFFQPNQAERIDPVPYRFPENGLVAMKLRPVVIGSGPAGLFCAYALAIHGYRPILLERGGDVEERTRAVEHFWQTGELSLDSNVQFGEGGAGTFSDGKLNTQVKDKDGRNGEVLSIFVKFGADPAICYQAKPHIGTDVLSGIVMRMRKAILEHGGTVRFHSQVESLLVKNSAVCGVRLAGGEEIACDQVVLATGHSARDTFKALYEQGIPMSAKSFAVGFRVEHPQTLINASQYGVMDSGALGAAPYKLSTRTQYQRGVYSFCMCPGGYVVNASSEPGRLAVNGMSYSGRRGINANSAIIVSVTPDDFDSKHPLAGLTFQRLLEERAYRAAGGKLPVQRYGDFCKQLKLTDQYTTEDLSRYTNGEALKPQCKGAYAFTDLSDILPLACSKAFAEGMVDFDRKIPGFASGEALLTGVESRTSSPVRIERDESLQSTVRGLYPCGEGAGYAGGITSAAMDGLRVAEQIASCYAPCEAGGK